jgi:hypothetical protein
MLLEMLWPSSGKDAEACDDDPESCDVCTMSMHISLDVTVVV